MFNPEMEHMMQRESEWHNQQQTIHEILSCGIQSFVDRTENIDQVFKTNEHRLCCIDEGVQNGDMRSAGSGILSEGIGRVYLIKKLKAAEVREVTSHAGCGAVELFMKKNGITDKSIDEVAIESSKQIAAELGVPYVGHITELKRPNEFHNARMIYIDGTGLFNPSKCKELPPGFVVSKKYMTPNQALSEVKLATDIALGHHGFGDKFSQKEPLIIVYIGETVDPIMEELKKTLDGRPIKIDFWKKDVNQEQDMNEKRMAA